MGTLRVQVKPANSGTVTVNVALLQWPGGTQLDETFEATTDNPMDQSWDLEPALYGVTIRWTSGYHNITGSTADNGITVDGKPLYYQVLGTPADGNGVQAVFGVNVS